MRNINYSSNCQGIHFVFDCGGSRRTNTEAKWIPMLRVIDLCRFAAVIIFVQNKLGLQEFGHYQNVLRIKNVAEWEPWLKSTVSAPRLPPPPPHTHIHARSSILCFLSFKAVVTIPIHGCVHRSRMNGWIGYDFTGYALLKPPSPIPLFNWSMLQWGKATPPWGTDPSTTSVCQLNPALLPQLKDFAINSRHPSHN